MIGSVTFSQPPVQYCLSEKVPEQRCELNFSLTFAIIVVLSNLVKVVCMFLTLWRHDVLALITIGDAIESFLDRPDNFTKGFCIYSDRLVRLLLEWEHKAQAGSKMNFLPIIDVTRETFLDDPESRKWRPQKRRWWSAVPTVRWVASGLLYAILTFIATIAYVTIASHGIKSDWDNLRKEGLGSPVGNNIIGMNHSLFITVIIANLPQVVLSYIYVLFNSLYTCMLAGHEWTQFAKYRKTLRVTSPVGAQRSTYWLQLPYRYSLPLVILSSLLAWLASQSLFLVKIEVMGFNNGKRAVQADKSVLIGTLIMLGAILLGLRKYTSDMPIASISSGAISAACHRPDDDPDAAVLPLQWGVVSKTDGLGHCCFSSQLVTPPIPGHLYV
ncbi:MAG: hypothetical protein Q9170_002700 [Blastenia crenularia]